MLTHAASDIFIAALVQSGPSRVTYLYAQHGGSSNTAPSGLPTDLAATTVADMVATAGGNDNGGLWIPIVAPPQISSTSPSLYDGNVANWFIPMLGTPSTLQYTGNFVPGTSKITSLALAVSRNVNDRSQDVLISIHLSPGDFAAFQIAANAQQLVTMPLQITT